MGINRLLKPGLFLYECIRIIFMAAVVVLSPGGNEILPRLIFMAPGVLFPLMALFIWLDVQRYRAYLPLFAAGKCIAIFTLLIWSIFSRHFTIGRESLWGLLSGDFFALAAVLMINKYVNKKDLDLIEESQPCPKNHAIRRAYFKNKRQMKRAGKIPALPIIFNRSRR